MVGNDESGECFLTCNNIKETHHISTTSNPLKCQLFTAKCKSIIADKVHEEQPLLTACDSSHLSPNTLSTPCPLYDILPRDHATHSQTRLPHIALDAVLRLADQIQTLLAPNTDLVSGDISPAVIHAWIESAEALLGEDIIYNDELIASLNLQDIRSEDYRDNDAAVQAGATLESILATSIQPHKLKGQSADDLRKTLKQVTNRHKIIDLLQNGQRSAMKESFQPNGGREVSSGGSYRKMRQICNQSVYDLKQRGRCVIFSYDALKEQGAMNELHVSPLVWATKAGKVLGRTCLHASKSSRNHSSYNESIDLIKSRRLYAMPNLPLLQDLAEMACRQQEAFPGEILAGATVDVSTAYNQFPMSPNAAKLTATQIDIPNLIGGWIKLIVIYIVGMFGCATAGDVYCQIAQTVDELHNAGRTDRPRSMTYIDDGLLIDSPNRISESMEQYIEHVECLLGNNQTIQREKVNIWQSELEGIGWHFDFAACYCVFLGTSH